MSFLSETVDDSFVEDDDDEDADILGRSVKLIGRVNNVNTARVRNDLCKPRYSRLFWAKGDMAKVPRVPPERAIPRADPRYLTKYSLIIAGFWTYVIPIPKPGSKGEHWQLNSNQADYDVLG